MDWILLTTDLISYHTWSCGLSNPSRVWHRRMLSIQAEQNSGDEPLGSEVRRLLKMFMESRGHTETKKIWFGKLTRRLTVSHDNKGTGTRRGNGLWEAWSLSCVYNLGGVWCQCVNSSIEEPHLTKVGLTLNHSSRSFQHSLYKTRLFLAASTGAKGAQISGFTGTQKYLQFWQTAFGLHGQWEWLINYICGL